MIRLMLLLIQLYTFHMAMHPSAAPETSCFPSGLHATADTDSECADKFARAFNLHVRHGNTDKVQINLTAFHRIKLFDRCLSLTLRIDYSGKRPNHSALSEN